MYEGTLAARSNRASWPDSVEILGEDGERIDISTATEIVVQVGPQQPADTGGYGNQSFSSPLLTATLSNGKVQHVELGVFAFQFTKSEMRGVVGGIYNVEITIEKDGETESLILGTVPIREGVVTL